MTDWNEFVKGNTLNKEYLLGLTSEKRKAVILEVGEANGQDGKYPKCLVEINGKKLRYNMNRPTAKNMSNKYGTDDSVWCGKILRFETSLGKNNQEIMIGFPQETEAVKEDKVE